MALTITAANSIFLLSLPDIFAVPHQIRDFWVDEAFDTAPAEMAVTMTGVDGEGVAGWVPREVVMTVTLVPTSRSFEIFEMWIAAMENIQEELYASASITIPSIERTYTGNKGVLTRYTPLPNARRTLQSCKFELKWLPGVLPAITSGPYALIPSFEVPAARAGVFILDVSELGGPDVLG